MYHSAKIGNDLFRFNISAPVLGTKSARWLIENPIAISLTFCLTGKLLATAQYSAQLLPVDTHMGR